jgi:hypothetical protein
VSAAETKSDAQAEAKAHFRRGVEDYEAHRLSEAAAEFKLAYDLSPAYKVLFNIGQVNAALGDAVAAADAYERYLQQGGNEIPPSRRQAVQAELTEQMARIGTVSLTCSPEGTSVQIDGKLMGTTPLARPLRLTEGRHTLTLIAQNHNSLVRELDVAGKSQVMLELSLQPVGTIAGAEPPPSAAETASAPVVSPPPSNGAAPVLPPSVLSPDSAPRSRTQLIIGYSSVAGGAALMLAGGVLAGVSVGKAHTAQDNERAASTANNGIAWDQAHSDLQSAKTLNTLGWVGFGVGAAVLAGGVALVASTPKSHDDRALTVAPWTTAHVTGMAAQVAF